MLYNVYHAPTTREEDVFIPELFTFAYQVMAETLDEVYESTNWKGIDDPVQVTGERICMVGLRSTSVGDVITEREDGRRVFMVAKSGFERISVRPDRFGSLNIINSKLIDGIEISQMFENTPDAVKGYRMTEVTIPVKEVQVGDTYFINGKPERVTASEVMVLGESRTVIDSQWVLSFNGLSIPFRSTQFIVIRRMEIV